MMVHKCILIACVLNSPTHGYLVGEYHYDADQSALRRGRGEYES